MARKPWWETSANNHPRRDDEPEHISELTLALEAATWFRPRLEVSDDCAG